MTTWPIYHFFISERVYSPQRPIQSIAHKFIIKLPRFTQISLKLYELYRCARSPLVYLAFVFMTKCAYVLLSVSVEKHVMILRGIFKSTAALQAYIQIYSKKNLSSFFGDMMLVFRWSLQRDGSAALWNTYSRRYYRRHKLKKNTSSFIFVLIKPYLKFFTSSFHMNT